jgi:hypothetical protein
VAGERCRSRREIECHYPLRMETLRDVNRSAASTSADFEPIETR